MTVRPAALVPLRAVDGVVVVHHHPEDDVDPLRAAVAQVVTGDLPAFFEEGKEAR